MQKLNNLILPFLLWLIVMCVLMRCNWENYSGTIEKSRFLGINFIRFTILDPSNKNGVWEEVSPTQVRLKPGMNPTEEEVLDIAGWRIDSIWPIFMQAYGLRRFCSTSLFFQMFLAVFFFFTFEYVRPGGQISHWSRKENWSPQAIYIGMYLICSGIIDIYKHSFVLFTLRGHFDQFRGNTSVVLGGILIVLGCLFFLYPLKMQFSKKKIS